MLFFNIGFYFPLFYLQLDAKLHGINETFAFYSVSIPFFSFGYVILKSTLPDLPVSHAERGGYYRPYNPWVFCSLNWRSKYGFSSLLWMLCSYLRYDRAQECCERGHNCHSIWTLDRSL